MRCPGLYQRAKSSPPRRRTTTPRGPSGESPMSTALKNRRRPFRGMLKDAEEDELLGVRATILHKKRCEEKICGKTFRINNLGANRA